MRRAEVIVNVAELYGEKARRDRLADYEAEALRIAGDGHDVVLTGAGPIWLYLRLAHVLHGVARTLTYRAPEPGDVIVFDHSSD